MSDDTSKHLEFVQQIIARMNGNSFQLKTWAVTLAAGLFALSDKSNPWFVVIAVVPVVVFWGLDAYYLQLETRYRGLYEHLCKHAEDPNYSKHKKYALNLKSYENLPAVSYWKIAISRTQFWVYFPLLFIVLVVVVIFAVNPPAAASH
ncbi:MAG TPA: hypothetical protein VML19_09700 [Verrucomicrobiae bacterium]|nr:hypothetical protein [Verrucomicrobiae bacterium]